MSRGRFSIKFLSVVKYVDRESEGGGGGELDSQEQQLKDAPTDIGIASWSPD